MVQSIVAKIRIQLSAGRTNSVRPKVQLIRSVYVRSSLQTRLRVSKTENLRRSKLDRL